MEEWGWSAVNLAFFYPNIFGFCLNQTEEFFLAVAARLPVGAPGRMGGRIPIHASWFANNPIWKSLRWLQGTFLKKQIMWRHFRYCHIGCHIGCSKLHLFFDAMRTHLIFGLMWLHPSWRTQRLDPLVPDHNGPFVSPLVCSRCIGYFRIVRYMEKVKQIHVILSRTPVSSKTDGVVHWLRVFWQDDLLAHLVRHVAAGRRMYGIPKACWLLAHATLRLLSQCCHSDASLRDYTFHLQQDVELPEVVPWWNLAMPPVFTCFHESTNGSTIDSSNLSLQLCYDLSQSYDVVGPRPCRALSGRDGCILYPLPRPLRAFRALCSGHKQHRS